jgi:hypothetical protein
MSPLDGDRRVDERIAKAAPGPKPTPDFAMWQQGHPEAVVALKAGATRTHPAFSLTRLLTGRLAKIAALVVLALGLGFAAGRLSSAGRVDVRRLRGELEASLLAAVDQRISKSLDGHSEQLKAEMAQQLRSDLARYAAQTLALTDQKIDELARSIAAVRSVDRQRIVSALGQIEMSRLDDHAQLVSDLQALARQGSPSVRRPSN